MQTIAFSNLLTAIKHIKYFSFLVTTSEHDVIFFPFHKLASQVEQTILYPMYIKSPLFWAYFSSCENPDDYTSCGSGHDIHTFSFVFFGG